MGTPWMRWAGLVLIMVVMVGAGMPVQADGDGRLNPNGAEYYTVYCVSDSIDIYRADGQMLQQIPIAYVLGLDTSGTLWTSPEGISVRRYGDEVILSGTNGNTAPEQGTKTFSMAACLDRNGHTPAPQTPPGLAATVAVEMRCSHEVLTGDTLYGIMALYGFTLDELAAYNGIADLSMIFVGQEIQLPGCAGVAAGLTNTRTLTPTAAEALATATTTPDPAAWPEDAVTHTVQAGEMLAHIALQYDVTVDAITAANGIDNPNLIWEGQRLLIP
jgi:LysM repeat protein